MSGTSRAVLGAVATGGLVILGTAILFRGEAPRTADQAATQTAASEAVVALLLPFAFDPADLRAGDAGTARRTDSMKAEVAMKLDGVMTETAAAQWKTTINAAIDRQASGASNLDLAGGVGSLDFRRTTIDGTTATVVGTIRIWQDYADPSSLSVTQGTGWYDFTVTAVRSADGWRADSVDFEQHGLAPAAGGSEP
jgi:hypothetical protein